MRLPSFTRKQKAQDNALPEKSTLDRLLTRDCVRDEFFLLYSKLLQERMPDCNIEFSGESVLRVMHPDQKESTTYLDNLWLKYKNKDEDRLNLIEKYVRLAEYLTKPEPTPERLNIVPVIKDAEYIHMLQPAEKFITEHLCGDLWVVYVEDQPERIVTLSRESVRAAGVAEAEVQDLALKNLERILPAVECHGDGPWYLLTAGADYVASLLLMTYVWDHVKELLEGDIVATVPTRGVLMFAGSESVEGIAEIRERSIEICNSGTHAISSTLIVRRDGNWSVFNAN